MRLLRSHCGLVMGIAFAALLFAAGTSISLGQAASAAALPPAGVQSSPTVVPCNLVWQQVVMPNQGSQSNWLFGLAAISGSDIWAVGNYADGMYYRTLIEHWDGSAWSIVPSIDPSLQFVRLNGASGVATNDVWTVGDYQNGPATLTLVEHWNGTAWTLVPSPNPGADSELNSVAAISANNAWAVGYYSDGMSGAKQTLIEHWDGSSWQVVPSPSVNGVDSVLQGISTASAGDVWTVGYAGNQTSQATLIEHWDGSSWQRVSSPSPGACTNTLHGVYALSANDIWAVGDQWSCNATPVLTLVENWDGSSWQVVPTPNPGEGYNTLVAVAAASPGDVWAVGYYGVNFVAAALLEHWDGVDWSVADSPTMPGAVMPEAVAAVSANNVWTVGYYADGSNYRTLAEHNGTCPDTPTPTATATTQPTATNTATATPTSNCQSAWETVTSRDPGTGGNKLNGVSAAGPNEIWAVGYYNDTGNSTRTLSEHWDGTQWSAVSSPNNGTNSNTLNAVSARTANDVWAVGNYSNSTTGTLQTLILHWDGTQWNLVTSPNSRPDYDQYLRGVVALSANDVWAVGSQRIPSSDSWTLIEHWDGVQWSIVPSADYPNAWDNDLMAVAAASPTDIWAVGSMNYAGGYSLTEHWDGTHWTIVDSPYVGPDANVLYGVVALSPNEVWAVGYYANGPTVATFVIRWAGTQWSVVPSPNLPSVYNYLTGVSATGSNDIWASGYTSSSSWQGQTMVEHWNGASWSLITSPSPGTYDNNLKGIAGMPGGDVWAVGAYFNSNGGAYRTLVERYQPCSPPPSPTPATSIPTATPLASPTTCAIQYPDVPPGSTFYSYVHCLACRGIISGYANGTFGPGNPVTRGQLSKIVSNSAGYTENFSTNTFEDVPGGSTFFAYVERLYAHGGIQGYACGNPEPCVPPGNKPYFRPGANVTRGQTSKIVAIAKNLPPPSPGQQTFEDVPPGSTFWQWIEPLAASGAIGGYPCGGSGELCVPPNNRPYFRAGANVTRGQSAKIVSTVFFPGCVTPARR